MSVSALSSVTDPNPLKRRHPYQPSLSNSARYSSVGQGISRLDRDSFGRCMGFLTTEELAGGCLISRSWRLFIDGAHGLHWKNASIREGVPVVEGEKREYKEEFKFLRPITISGRTIARYLGKIVGEVPRMRQDRFLELRDSLDFFEPEKLKKDTHVVLVDPAFIKITTGPNRPLALDESGTLVEVPEAERAGMAPEELTVPFSFKNLKALVKYPLAGMENRPVFSSDSRKEVFEQCGAPPSQNSILIMGSKVVATDMPLNGGQGQKAQLKNLGCEVTTARQRGLYDAIKILATGTCPDNRELLFARTAECVRLGATDYPAAIGSFIPGFGVFVTAGFNELAYNNLGVVPVVSAEVLRPLELVDNLETDEGH